MKGHKEKLHIPTLYGARGYAVAQLVETLSHKQ